MCKTFYGSLQCKLCMIYPFFPCTIMHIHRVKKQDIAPFQNNGRWQFKQSTEDRTENLFRCQGNVA